MWGRYSSEEECFVEGEKKLDRRVCSADLAVSKQVVVEEKILVR